MAVLFGNPSDFQEMMETMGFVHDEDYRYHFGADLNPNVYVIVGDNNAMEVVCSRANTSGTLSGEGYSGNPLKIEYFPLKNGGVVFRAKYVSTQSDAIGYPFCFCAFKNGDGNYEYVYRAYIIAFETEYQIYHDNNKGRLTRILAPTASFLADNTANVISLSGLYNQVDGFLPDDIKLCTICSNTLGYSKSYGVTIDGDTYVMGMSESDSSSGGVGGRIAFKIMPEN